MKPSILLRSVVVFSLLASPALAAEETEEPAESAEISAAKSVANKVQSVLQISPELVLVGGLKADTVIQGDNELRQGRVGAMLLSLFGLAGKVGQYVTFESQFMANGGTGLHGSSAWEGQAAFQVRQQIIRLSLGSFVLEGGRVLDEATLNFVSAHVVDTLYQDTAVRDPLLYSGFNMGNGIRATYELLEGLRLGFTFTAGNPVATTASAQVGGSFPPFDRFYIQPWQAVQQAPNTFPDDTFHILIFAPAVLFSNAIVDAKAAFQQFIVDTNTNRRDVANIKGYNVRGDLRLKLANNLIVPFVNVSLERNDTVQPTDSTKLAADKYLSRMIGGGVDINLIHVAPGRETGFGAQYDQVQYQVGSGDVTTLHYINVGGTYWIEEHFALGLRAAIWFRDDSKTPNEGERSLIASMQLRL